MDKTPLVSVIIPNYNHARYLDQRLQSVLGQTYPNFEVIILDDKSTDNSLEVIAKYQNDPHVAQVVVNEQNSGNTFKQWDKGISFAKGDIIWIAESDDFCELNMLEVLVKAYTKKKGVVLAYSIVSYVGDDGIKWGQYNREGRTQYFRSDFYIKRYLVLDNAIQNASCAIFSKAAAKKVDNGYQNVKGLGDWWFWIGIAQQGNVCVVNKSLSYFTKHRDSVTAIRAIDGSNMREEHKLMMYLRQLYYIPQWKWLYIYKQKANQKRNVPFVNDKIAQEMNHMWGFDKRYSSWQQFYCRVLNHLQRRYLIRL